MDFFLLNYQCAAVRHWRPETFDFLGFTHICGKSRKGKFVVKRKTAAKRMRRSLKRVSEWCRNHRHVPLEEQHRMLCAKLRGHYNYYGITGNMPSLEEEPDGGNLQVRI